jgi:antitoxin (DNA-binding transcriptional repressor) of toxin-antitoxin stability system
VRELKDRLSKYLHRAEAGEEVVVTSHGRPIVRMTAIGPTPAGESEADALARLSAQPWVRAGDGGRIGPAPYPVPAAPPR